MIKIIRYKFNHFVSNKKTVRVVEGFFGLWIIGVFFFYYYFHSYFLSVILSVTTVALGIVIAILIVRFVNSQLKLVSWAKILEMIEQKLCKTYTLNTGTIIALFVYFAVFFTIFLSGYLHVLWIDSFFQGLISIVAKIISISIVYVLFVVVAFSVGIKILRRFSLGELSFLFQVLLSIAFGFVVISIVVLALGFLGLFYKTVAVVLVVILLLVGVTERKNVLSIVKKEVYITIKRPFFSSRNTKVFVVLVLAMFLLLYFISVLKPGPTDTDSLHTYFNAPLLYTQYHKIIPLTHLPLLNMPQNMEMLYTLFLLILPMYYLSLFSLLFYFLSLLALWEFGKYFFGGRSVLFALLVFISMPLWMQFVDFLKVDIGLIFYSLMVLLCIHAYWQNQIYTKKYWLILGGIFLGFLLGIKYTAFIFALSVALVYSLAYLVLVKGPMRTRIFNLIKLNAIFFSVAFFVFLPWLAKNYFYFRNPLYPFSVNSVIYKPLPNSGTVVAPQEEYDFFRKRSDEMSEILLAGKNTFDRDYYTLMRIISTFLNYTFDFKGKDFISGHSIGPLFLAFFPLVMYYFFLTQQKRQTVIFLLSLSGIFLFIWFYKVPVRIWHALPIFTVLSLLTGFAIDRVFIRDTDFLKNISFVGMFIFIVVVFLFIYNTRIKDNFYYLTGYFSAEQYLSLRSTPYLLGRYLNTHFVNTKKGKLLLVPDLRMAYIEKNDQYIIPDPNLSHFGYLASVIKNNSELKTYLKKEGINYIIVSNETIEFYQSFQYQDVFNYILNPYPHSVWADIKTLKRFLAHEAHKIGEVKCLRRDQKICFDIYEI